MIWIEIFAVFFGLMYITLSAIENVWCWLAGFISVCLYMFIFYNNSLYGQAFLQIFYLVMSIYGFIMWNKENSVQIKEWPISAHMIILSIGTILAFFIGFYFSQYTNSPNAIVDALTTVFSIFATIMVTRKIIENWLYWIIIDLLLTYLCFTIESYIAAGQFLLFTIIAIFGYFSWIRKMRTND